MYYTFLYTFFATAVLSSIFIVFSGKKNLTLSIIFILSVSGILALINAGYVSFILIFTALLFYIVKKVKQDDDTACFNDEPGIKFTGLLSAALFGAVLASAAGSTLWQGKTILHKEISASGITDFIVNDYFVLFLLALSALPVFLQIFYRDTAR